MTFAIITAVLFAFSAIFNTRITKLMDALFANFFRLLIACLILGLLTATFQPESFHPEASAWLLLSGAIGFGIGDIALFAAFSRIGSRLTILINFSLGAIIGALADWMLLDDSIGAGKCLSIVIILGGLAIALLSSKGKGSRQGSFRFGIMAALIAGVGQGLGSSISRYAEPLAEASGITIGGISQAFQRVTAGLFCLTLVCLWKYSRRKFAPAAANKATIAWWLVLAAIFGPVLGVSCFQQSLKTLTSGEAMAITATSPLLLIPLAYFFEGERIRAGSLIGALFGVGGVIAMALIRS